MTFKAELIFNDSNFIYNILDCDYEFTQEIDGSGKPCAMPKCGIINLVMESMSDPAMIQWMLAPGNVRSGKITFYKDDSATAKLKTLTFKQAICVHLQERFSSYGESPMILNISFVAKEVSLDGVNYIAQWTNF